MNRQSRHRLLQLALIGLALRAIAPAGYMPAPLADGLPFVLCPGGWADLVPLPAAADGARHDHGHNPADGGAQEAVAWNFCPFGLLFASLGPVAEQASPPALPATDPPPFRPERTIATLFTHSWSARAPPNSRLVDDRRSV